MNIAEEFEERIREDKIPQFLYRYRSVNNEFIEDELVNNYLYFSDWTEFNDPFEGKISLNRSYSIEELFRLFSSLNKQRGSVLSKAQLKQVAEKIHRDKTCFISVLHSLLVALHKKIGVCCFTKKNDNLLMWAHYADSHKGICLEFEPRQDLQIFSLILQMQYRKDFLPFNFLDDSKSISYLNLISQKSEEWKYEEEYRVYKYDFLDRKYGYNPRALKSVIFGCKTSEETISKIKKLFSNNPFVSYKKCEQDNNSYKLNIIDC